MERMARLDRLVLKERKEIPAQLAQPDRRVLREILVPRGRRVIRGSQDQLVQPVQLERRVTKVIRGLRVQLELRVPQARLVHPTPTKEIAATAILRKVFKRSSA